MIIIYELSVHAAIKFIAEPYPVLVAMDSVYNFYWNRLLFPSNCENQTHTEFNKSFILHITHFCLHEIEWSLFCDRFLLWWRLNGKIALQATKQINPIFLRPPLFLSLALPLSFSFSLSLFLSFGRIRPILFQSLILIFAAVYCYWIWSGFFAAVSAEPKHVPHIKQIFNQISNALKTTLLRLLYSV